jgi:hypothetical protein
MYKLLISSFVIGCLVSTPVMAIGDIERGVLYGIGGLWAIQQLNRAGQSPQQPQTYGNPPVAVPTYPNRSYIHEPIYKAVDVYIPECSCYRTFMIQVN